MNITDDCGTEASTRHVDALSDLEDTSIPNNVVRFPTTNNVISLKPNQVQPEAPRYVTNKDIEECGLKSQQPKLVKGLKAVMKIKRRNQYNSSDVVSKAQELLLNKRIRKATRALLEQFIEQQAPKFAPVLELLPDSYEARLRTAEKVEEEIWEQLDDAVDDLRKILIKNGSKVLPNGHLSPTRKVVRSDYDESCTYYDDGTVRKW